MKKKNLLCILILVLIAAFIAAAPVMAKAVKSNFSGTSYFVTPIDPQNWMFFYPNGNEHARGMVLLFEDVVETGDARIGGMNTVVVNYNFRPVPGPGEWAGPMWGTIRVVNDDGYWEGTYTGERTKDGFLYIRSVYHGGGEYEGLHAKVYLERLSPDPTAPSAFWGYILDPHGR